MSEGGIDRLGSPIACSGNPGLLGGVGPRGWVPGIGLWNEKSSGKCAGLGGRHGAVDGLGVGLDDTAVPVGREPAGVAARERGVAAGWSQAAGVGGVSRLRARLPIQPNTAITTTAEPMAAKITQVGAALARAALEKAC